MDREYKKVSCDFYDELEAFAIMRKTCKIEYWNENGIKTMAHDQIRNLYSREGIEWLETAKGLKIRLDELIKVDEKTPFNQC